jgi:hypothetical protein
MYASDISKKNCSFHIFGRRNSDGCPMRTLGSRGTLPWTEIPLEDMEAYVYNLEHLLRAEMKSSDEAKELLHENQERIHLLENTILKLGDKKDALEAANQKLRDKTLNQDALIAGLQGHCVYVYLN